MLDDSKKNPKSRVTSASLRRSTTLDFGAAFLLGKCVNFVRKEDGMDHEIVAMWVQTLSSVVGLGCIVWGLFAMQ